MRLRSTITTGIRAPGCRSSSRAGSGTQETAKGADVDGVILERIVFCDSHGVDAPMLAEELEKQGTPTLVLEREYALSDVGRLKTRVEAFLERIART